MLKFGARAPARINLDAEFVRKHAQLVDALRASAKLLGSLRQLDKAGGPKAGIVHNSTRVRDVAEFLLRARKIHDAPARVGIA